MKQLPPCSSPAFDVSVSEPGNPSTLKSGAHFRSGEPLYHVDAELIRQLHPPDLLITQSHCEVCAVTPADVERTGGAAARQLALSAASLDEIFQSILLIAQELGLEQQGEALVRRERQRLDTIRENAARFRRPTVAMLEWTDPLFAMGNWGPELVEIANGELRLGKKGEYSAAIPAEQLRDADPEYLIVAPCGFNLERSWSEKDVLEQYPCWPKLASCSPSRGNVAFADGNLFFNRSGMTISQTAEIIAEILHGLPVSAGTDPMPWRWIESGATAKKRGAGSRTRSAEIRLGVSVRAKDHD